MPSATDFLPSSMTEFMNLVRTTSPKRGSGRTSRFSGRRRRDIGVFLSLQPDPEPVGSHQSTTLMGALSGAYSLCVPAKAGTQKLDSCFRRRTAVLRVIWAAWRRIWNGTGGGL